MRKILMVYVIIGLVVLSPFSEFCHADPDTILVDASEHSVDVRDAEKFYDFTCWSGCYITLNGSWYYDNTNDHPQKYVVSYYRPRTDEPYKSKIFVVGEEYDLEIGSGFYFYFYFPDPGDVLDNHGIINVTFKTVFFGDPIKEYIEVDASDHSIRIDTNAQKYEFLDGGTYQLDISGEWYHNDTSDEPQRYVLAYYSGTESEWSEKLVNGSQHLWNVSKGAIAYFYMPFRYVNGNNGEISVEISALGDPPDDSKWYLEPVWIGIWLGLISITIGVIGFMAARRRR